MLLTNEESLEPQNVAWTKRTLDSLKIGGVWGVPRHFIIIHRTGETTVTIQETEATATCEDYAYLLQHIAAAGYTIQKGDTGAARSEATP
jgi:hypothetical protein